MNRFTLKQLKYFVTVVETESIAEASRQLNAILCRQVILRETGATAACSMCSVLHDGAKAEINRAGEGGE
ncbi:hypothetical protein KAM622c_28510 [Klebsiella quasipneumoniae subsp. quasipneumoniae]|nr:LysR family transcriptional regulator [Klebsiella quasipneumoniae]BDO03264.1 hypothetical protein KAM622c_28510 [Klebsiella quasipneumoniae subsp. quasipneumoniae]